MSDSRDAAPQWRHALSKWIWPILPGLLGFLLVVGIRPLRPTNVRWIQGSDPLKDYMGWSFFRHSPWSLPLGANPQWGMEKAGASIFFSDSIPVLALIFKPFTGILTEPFQYDGLWLLLCFALQSYFAWKLIARATGDPILRAFGALLFVFAPPMMMRIGLHYALVGQWILLAAIWISVEPPRYTIATWAFVVSLTVLIHPYLAAMVLALWAANWCARLRGDGTSILNSTLEVVVVLGCCALTLWQAGAFMMANGVGREGFGYYRMNLNTFFNPKDEAQMWSYLMPALPGISPGEYEGFSFLGLGGLLCVATGIGMAGARWRMVAPHVDRAKVCLLLACATLMIVAATNDVSVGTHLLHYEVPDRFIDALGALRATGRFVWPAFYVLVWLSVAVIAKTMRRAVAVAVVACLACGQIIDTSRGWIPHREALNERQGPTFYSPLTNPFWWQAGSFYTTIRVIPWRPLLDEWDQLAVYADRHRMQTESAYLTRYDREKVRAVEEVQMADLTSGRFEPKSLYILTEGVAQDIAPHIRPDVDLLEQIDGLWVLAPGWKAHQNASKQ